MFGKAANLKVDSVTTLVETIASSANDKLRAIKLQLDSSGTLLNQIATIGSTEDLEQDFEAMQKLCEKEVPCLLLVYISHLPPRQCALINWLPDNAPAKARFAQRAAHRVVKDLLNHHWSDVTNLDASELEDISLAAFEEVTLERKQQKLHVIHAVQQQVEIVHVPVRGVIEHKLSIVVMSDTHNLHDTLPPDLLPDADIFIHCGDFTNHGTLEEVQSFDRYMAQLACTKSYRTKLIVAGNHDVGNFSETEFAGSAPGEVLSNVEYLNNETIEVEGLKIHGCSWNHRGCRKVPAAVDILITHEPPKGILDCGLGCEHLMKDVIRAVPKVHVFGHVHPGNGFQRGSTQDAITTTFVNAAVAGGGLEDLRSVRTLDRSIILIQFEP